MEENENVNENENENLENEPNVNEPTENENTEENENEENGNEEENQGENEENIEDEETITGNDLIIKREAIDVSLLKKGDLIEYEIIVDSLMNAETEESFDRTEIRYAIVTSIDEKQINIIKPIRYDTGIMKDTIYIPNLKNIISLKILNKD